MPSPSPVSVLLVDDSTAFRQGVRTLLEFCELKGGRPCQVVGEAASTEQAVHLAIEQHPLLILLDLELPGESGVVALQRLSNLDYHGKTLVLSAHHEDECIFQAMEAGASGYVFKNHLATELPQAMDTVLNHEMYLAPEAATSFFRAFHFYGGRTLKAVKALHLTKREQQVLHWLVKGEANQAIAQHLSITTATVKAHLTAIFEKLEVGSRSQAIVKALKLGLVNPVVE